MSSLYSVRVAARPDDHTVDLDIKVIHPDAMRIPVTPGFALMLLHDQASGAAPLAGQVDLDTLLDEAWATAYARAFVESVELLSSKNEPPAEALDDYDHRYWRSSKRWLEGRLRIRATHPAWISHVHGSWDSAAFNPASEYEPCPPATPDAAVEVEIEADIERSEGFLPVPRLMIASQVDAACPELVWIPRYGARAYEPSERWTGIDITMARLGSWIGRPVIYRDQGSQDTQIGVVTRTGDESVMLTSLSPGGYRTNHSSPTGLAWIGSPAFRRGSPRLPQPLMLEAMLERAWPAADVVHVEGRELTLRVFSFSREGGQPQLGTAADVLRLIAVPARGRFSDFDGSSAKLGKALQRLMQKRGIAWDTELYPQVAHGFVESFEVEAPPRPRAENLDALPREQVVDFIAQRRWPAWTVRVVVSDAAWLEHLVDAVPWTVESGYLQPPEAWDDPPYTWDPELERDDVEDDDGEAGEVDASTKSSLRRRFELPGPVTRFAAPADSSDPKAVLRDHGLWEDVTHPFARDNFHAACKSGNVDAVRAYVALGIDTHWAADISFETPLIRAAEGDQPEVVRVLARAGVDLQRRDGGGDTAIRTAVNWNTPAALRALLEVGADPDVPDNYDNYPLVKALSEGRDELVEILLEGGASPNAGASTQDSAPQWCLRENNVDRLRALLAREGADVNQSTSTGHTLLHLAVFNQDEEAVEALLEAGADVSKTNSFGWTARDVAMAQGADDLAERLEQAGAALTKADVLGYFEAITAGDREAVAAALDAGVHVDTRDAHGNSGLMLAVGEDRGELVELLLARGADVDARADDSDALSQASSAELRRRLLEAGCSASYRDSKGVLRQPGLAAVLEEDDHELLAVLLGPTTRGLDLGDLSVCNLSLIWGSYEDRLEARAQTLKTLGAAGADLDACDASERSSLLNGYINRGYEQPVVALIEAGADLERADKNYVTPLIKSCGDYSNHDVQARITRALLEHGADYGKTDWLGNSAWDAANSVDNEGCIAALELVFEQTLRDALAERGLAEDSDPEDHDAALFEALARRTKHETFRHFVRKGEHAIVRGLLAAGFDPNPPQHDEHGVRPGELPLTAAISAGDAAMVEVLLEGGANPNLVQMWGSTAMSYAVGEQRVDMVRQLLAAGADPQPFDDSGHTPMGSAAAHGNLELLELLVEAGASVQPRASGRLPLHAAVQSGRFEATQWLLAHGADIDARQEGRTTALHVAIEKDEVEIALALLAAGADPNVQTSDEHRHTPLILATKKGNLELVAALLAAGADPHVRDAEGQSAIDHAGYREELRVLFPDAGEARSFERIVRQLPPLLRAVHQADREAFSRALAEAEDVNVGNYRGDTALMIAASLGHRHMVDALLEVGADVNARNCKGDTAWSYAFSAGQEELRKLFEQRGAAISMDGLNQMAGQSMRRDAAIEAIKAGDVGRVAKLIDELELDVDFLGGRVRPLRLAIERGDSALVQLLLAKGADASLDAGEGKSLREHAEAAGVWPSASAD